MLGFLSQTGISEEGLCAFLPLSCPFRIAPTDIALAMSSLESRVWSFGVICFAAASFPIVLMYTLAVAAWYRLIGAAPKRVDPNGTIKRTAIVTGGKMTKALCVCRHLKQAGCRVILVETHKYYMVASRFSDSVDRFVTVPVPEKDPDGYRQALKVLAYEEDADLFVPVSSPVASVYDASISTVLPPGCRSLSLGQTLTAALDDKVTFGELARSCGLTVPDSRRMCSHEDVFAFNEQLLARGEGASRYVLKNLAYDSMRRLDLFTLPAPRDAVAAYIADIEMSAKSPWLVQEFITGTEYSTCAIAHDGHLALFTDNVASISCFNYEHAGDSRLRKWVETFCAAHKLSGVVCIDFFIDGAGTPLAIECNPRFSSNITNFHNSPTAWRAFLEPEELARRGEVETPRADAGESCWTAVDLYYALSTPTLPLSARVRRVYDTLVRKKDAYFDAANPAPFLALHYVHIPTLLARNIVRGNRWAKIDMCIGKLTEENGD